MGFLYHCMAKVDQSRVILTGGADLNGQTLLVDTTNEDYVMVPGPRLAHERQLIFSFIQNLPFYKVSIFTNMQKLDSCRVNFSYIKILASKIFRYKKSKNL